MYVYVYVDVYVCVYIYIYIYIQTYIPSGPPGTIVQTLSLTFFMKLDLPSTIDDM